MKAANANANTTIYRRKKRVSEVINVTNEQVQQDWISGIQDQINFANNIDVLPDYILSLKIARRRIEP